MLGSPLEPARNASSTLVIKLNEATLITSWPDRKQGQRLPLTHWSSFSLSDCPSHKYCLKPCPQQLSMSFVTLTPTPHPQNLCPFSLLCLQLELLALHSQGGCRSLASSVRFTALELTRVSDVSHCEGNTSPSTLTPHRFGVS